MKANFLKKIFHVPNYLSLQVAGVEICNRSIKYIEFLNKNGVFSVKNFGEISIAENIVKDGNILNKDALAKSLIEVKKNISSDFVKISIPEEKTYIFDAQIPEEAKDNIREALEFKIEENVPLKLAESSFEYEVVGKNKKTPENMMTVNVSVIPKVIISDYIEVFDKAGICLLSFELGSKMIATSIIPKESSGKFIIMSIKSDSTVFVAVIDGIARFASSVAIGENLIKEKLFKTGLFKDKINDNNFFEKNFSFETACTKESCLSLINIFSILKDEVEKFNEYIIKKFFDDDFSIKKIDKIILCGRSSILPGLSKHINQNIKTEVVLANVWANAFDIKEYVPKLKFNDSLDFVTPIGLAISSYKEINA